MLFFLVVPKKDQTSEVKVYGYLDLLLLFYIFPGFFRYFGSVGRINVEERIFFCMGLAWRPLGLGLVPIPQLPSRMLGFIGG
jgi:hypothetical protein